MIKKGTLFVQSYLPDKLSALSDISYNLWWSYNPEFLDLLKYIDIDLIGECENNPILFLKKISTIKLEEVLRDPYFVEKYDSLLDSYTSYMTEENTWFNTTYPMEKHKKIAYFSAEYGIHEVMPTYSGGLGVLSGDHLKSASDMGIPLTGIGLFYKHGYFDQSINFEGWQQSSYSSLDPASLPMKQVMDEKDLPIYIDVDFPGRIIYLSIWSVNVGRIKLYYLDSDNPRNSLADRELTSSLYGGNNETRIQQEMLMGIGGVKLLDYLDIKCDMYHMNEGHQAFVILELLKKHMKDNSLSLEEASEVVRSKAVFTTHTPVPSGIDVFPAFLVEKYLSKYIDSLNLTRESFFSFASNSTDTSSFNMAAFALNFSGLKNGVSKLHGKVSRSLFSWLWPDVPTEEIPISYVTNGVHTLSWLNPGLKSLLDKYMDQNWKNSIHIQNTWDKVDDIPDKEFWDMHILKKKEAIDYFRKRIIKRKESVFSIDETDNLLDPAALTIGFARRFATYKRATLIFKDIAKIEKIINDTGKPVQIIFAGKAHPADHPGQELIKRIVDLSRQSGFKGKLLFLENYNIELARQLLQGVDIWLNNPRRPLEASGTSGQKAAINGVVNMSVLDGWWIEGYTKTNGFVIGENISYLNQEDEDIYDSRSIYSQLEYTIIPMFYDFNNEGLPKTWIRFMKESIKTNAWRFSSNRMLADYTEKMYVPTLKSAEKMASNNYSNSRKLAEFKKYISSKWAGVNIYSFNGSLSLSSLDLSHEAPTEIFIDLYLADIDHNDVVVELCIEKDVNEFIDPLKYEMIHVDDILNGCHRYHLNMSILDTGRYIYSFRIIPKHELILNRFDFKLIRWA